MTLSSGTRLGSYEVLAPIGKGGMGEVWKAHDTKLGRDVALKILPAAFASDPDRMARFEREARVLASLDHPNIAAIYGLEESDGVRALVLALIDGPTLADRIAAGPIPLDEAIQIARQIAEAVEYAHERGVIHRDLKPANIKITSGGMVKVLDFGLAKALDDEPVPGSGTNSPTLTMGATRAGVLLGTAQYMSPEQAKGKQADRRSDIWSFGAVLYEMVTGKPPFSGESVGEVIAAVIKDEPKLDAVPPEVCGLVARCLNKDPRQRLQAIGEARIALEHPVAVAESKVTSAKRKSLLASVVSGLLVVLLVVVSFLYWHSSRTSELKPLLRLEVDLGPEVSFGASTGNNIALSADGTLLAYVSQDRLYIRSLDQPLASELAGTFGASSPFFSPDGRWIAFYSQGKLKKISVDGRTAITLCDATGLYLGGAWGEDGDIVAALSINSGLSRIPSAGGGPTPITELDRSRGEQTHRFPQILPGGKQVLFTAHVRAVAGDYDGANIEIVNLSDHSRKTLVRGGTFGRYLSAGYITYVNRGTLFAVPFDLDRLQLRGTPIPVLDQITYSTASGAAQLDVSSSGTLIYRNGANLSTRRMQWLDSTGRIEPLHIKPGLYSQPRLSPDGTRLAFATVEGSGSDIWIYDPQADTVTRLTFGGFNDSPVWTPDSRYIIFRKAGEGVRWTRANGSGEPQALTHSKNSQYPNSLAPDGKRLLFDELLPGYDIWTLPIEVDNAGLKPGKAEAFLSTPANERFPSLSPDGRWVAYASDESGAYQVYVRAFPDRGGKWQISTEGGSLPRWSPNGHELFFRADSNRIMVAPYAVDGESFVPGKARLWSEIRLADIGAVSTYDVAPPDGKRILAVVPDDAQKAQEAQNHVTFLLNFFDELRRHVPITK